MSILRVTCPREVSYEAVLRLGRVGKVEFRDLGGEAPVYTREWSGSIRRVEECMRISRYLSDSLSQRTVEAVPTADVLGPDCTDAIDRYVAFLASDRSLLTAHSTSSLRKCLDEVDPVLHALEDRVSSLLKELSSSYERRSEIQEELAVLALDTHFASPLVGGDTASAESEWGEKTPLIAADTSATSASQPGFADLARSAQTARGAFRVVAGVIATSQLHTFERQVWRLTRGVSLVRSADIPPMNFDNPDFDPGKRSDRTVVAVYSSNLSSRRVEKLVAASDGHVYSLAASFDGGRGTHESTLQRDVSIADDVLRSRAAELASVANAVMRILPNLDRMLRSERAVYATLNMSEMDEYTCRAEMFLPVSYEAEVRRAVSDVTSSPSGRDALVMQSIPLPKGEVFPTYFELDRFTESFQGIVTSYGIPDYKEANPAVLTIITFPFLFGVMFGDAGHGSFLALIGLTLVMGEKRFASVKDEIFQMIFGARYLVLLMGLFAAYMGCLYNDMFSLSVPWLQNTAGFQFLDAVFCAEDAQDPCCINATAANMMHPRGSVCTMPNASDPHSAVTPWYQGANYPNTPAFGVDSSWVGAMNQLDFYNSMKMKMAVILGVCQMMVGIVLSGLNHWRFKKYFNIVFSTIPEVIFLGLTFGYMDVLILGKWVRDWQNTVGTFWAPSVLNIMTGFFLSNGKEPVPNAAPIFGSIDINYTGEKETIIGTPWQYGKMQKAFFFLVIICIPAMLFPLMVLNYLRIKREKASHGAFGPEVASARIQHRATDSFPDASELVSHDTHALSESEKAAMLAKRHSRARASSAAATAPAVLPPPAAEEEDEETFGQYVIHLLIHVIECVRRSLTC